MQVRVRQAGRGAVLVLWDRDASVQEFAVSVAPEVGSVHSIVTVACHQRGSVVVKFSSDMLICQLPRVWSARRVITQHARNKTN